MTAFEDADVREFAALDEPGREPLVTADDGSCAIPVDGLALVWGPEGAGKTTVVNDWLVQWSAGADWHGVLEPQRPLRIYVVENEGPRAEFRRKLRRRFEFPPGPQTPGLLRVLTEPWASVDLRDEQHRGQLAQRLAHLEIELCVAGPLFALGMTGGGTADDINEFTRHLFDVRARSGLPVTFLIVHHANAAGRVSGAWGPRPDLTAAITPGEREHLRVFWEKAKWSTLHRTTTRLVWAEGETFEVEEREVITDERVWEEIAAYVFANGGCSWTKASGPEVTSVNDEQKRRVRTRMLADGVLVNLGKQRKDGNWDYKLWHRDDPTLQVQLDPAGLAAGPPAGPAEGMANQSPAVRLLRSRAGLPAGLTSPATGDTESRPESSGPLIGDTRYLPWLFERFERGEIDEAERHLMDQAHRDALALEVGTNEKEEA